MAGNLNFPPVKDTSFENLVKLKLLLFKIIKTPQRDKINKLNGEIISFLEKPNRKKRYPNHRSEENGSWERVKTKFQKFVLPGEKVKKDEFGSG